MESIGPGLFQLCLSQDEIDVIVEQLRIGEKCSRKGLAAGIARWAGDPSKVSAMEEKLKRASAHFKLLVDLRAKLGDTSPVKLD